MTGNENNQVWLGVMQPSYFPWLGFYDQLDRADLFIDLDHVEFSKNSWRNRNRILTPAGPHWLTVPVKHTNTDRESAMPPINRVRIDTNRNWSRKHIQTIKQNYSKAPFLNQYLPTLEAALNDKYEYLVDLIETVQVLIIGWLGISTPRRKSSEMAVEGQKSNLVLNICRMCGATDYYSGAAGRDYIDVASFEDSNVRVWYQNYQPKPYPQLFGQEFSSHLSIIDLLFNVGPESLDVIRAGRLPANPH